MTLPDTAPQTTPTSRAAENDDVGDAFARSPTDAVYSISENSRGLRSQDQLGSIRSSSRFANSSSGIYFLGTVCDAIAKAGTSESSVAGPSRKNIANSNGTSSMIPMDARAPSNNMMPSANINTMGNTGFLQPGQPGSGYRAGANQPIAPSPSRSSLDENQVLWLIDIPNLLDDQSLNFSPVQAGPSVGLRATSEFNVDARFNSLRMNMGNEEMFYFTTPDLQLRNF